MNDDLRELLLALDGVEQSRRYHPEGDALFHSLQVFDLARAATHDRELWAAALFHDVGKSISDPETGHDEIGADLLSGLVSSRVEWLVRHHLDLLRDPRGTRRKLFGTPELRDLELLRRWDLGGRRPTARVLSPESALSILCSEGFSLSPDDPETNDHTLDSEESPAPEHL
jgi:hypothetical protein